MNTNDLVLAIDNQISQLQQARALLIGNHQPKKRRPGRPSTNSSPSAATSFNPAEFKTRPPKKRTMSPEGRARVAAAQRERWAKTKNIADKTSSTTATKRVKKAAPKSTKVKKTIVAKKAAPRDPAIAAS